jgi:hypothetical protein
MPVGTRVFRELGTPAAELSRRLADEWRDPSGPDPEPFIVEEQAPGSSATRIYVFWSEWSGLSQRERSEIIMDAYEKARGLDPSRRVTLAMGLTPEEARQMGLRYE